MPGLGLLVLRLTLAVILVAHGAHQTFDAFGSDGVGAGGFTHTAAYYSALGLEPGYVLAVCAGLIQLFGGMLIAIGYLTRWVGIAVIGYHAIAIWKDHARWGFFLNWVGDKTRGQGMEFSILVIGAVLCLVLGGAGKWSIDGYRAEGAAARAAGRARLRGR
jgi:putative oxidoreductase